MRFLLYKWKVFNQEDIKAALERAGHEVHVFNAVDFVREKQEEIENMLAEKFARYDIVFSVNYFQEVSGACMKAGKKYISWTVDSPMLTMYHDSVYNPCNYIFIFDKFNYMQFKAMELNHVYYLPLAVDSERLEHLLENTKPDEKEKFSSDISFVGGLYDKNSYDDIYESLPPYLRGYFDSAFRAQLDIFGDNIFDRILTPDILAELSECVDFRQDENSFSDIKLIFTNTFLGYKMAVKVLSGPEEAVAHIARYGSGHSECIVTEDSRSADYFMKAVDAACVYVNVPTSFTDGGEFGLGAEIGISTQKLHARGPMGLEELNTYKWIVRGEGQTRD